MRTETITYTDYDGNERTEKFRFSLNKAEVTQMDLTFKGGMKQYLDDAVAAGDIVKMADFFKQILLNSYGVKSADGSRFVKTDEAKLDFVSSIPYETIYMKLLTDQKYAESFFNDVCPKKEETKKG